MEDYLYDFDFSGFLKRYGCALLAIQFLLMWVFNNRKSISENGMIIFRPILTFPIIMCVISGYGFLMFLFWKNPLPANRAAGLAVSALILFLGIYLSTYRVRVNLRNHFIEIGSFFKKSKFPASEITDIKLGGFGRDLSGIVLKNGSTIYIYTILGDRKGLGELIEKLRMLSHKASSVPRSSNE